MWLLSAIVVSGICAQPMIKFADAQPAAAAAGTGVKTARFQIDGQSVEHLPSGAIPPVPGSAYVDTGARSSTDAAPLLDDADYDPLIGEQLGDCADGGRRGVEPYGGGHKSDWWGCGGSPYRTGPGACDNYRVGPIWNVNVDGMVMKREGTNLAQIWNETDGGFDDGSWNPAEGPQQGIPELFEQFDWSAGGRIEVLGKHPKCAGYQILAAGEGIEKWEATIIYPKQTLLEINSTNPQFGDANNAVNPPGITNTDAIVYQVTSQRRVHYTSNLYAGELDIIHCQNPLLQPYCGVRYFRFNDQLRIEDDQNGLGPIDLLDPPPIEVLTTDMSNIYDLQNDLFGFQLGLRHDLWRPNTRFAIEAFVNGGVYYNKIKYANYMSTTTVQQLGDVTPVNNVEANNFSGTTNVVSNSNLASANLAEIAYHYEASISGVCRLNKCWAMRAGYQVLMINGLRLADESFLDPDIFLDNGTHSLLFQGWHAGIECRR